MMEGKKEEIPLLPSVGGFHDDTGGARPKATKQENSPHGLNSAVDARLKAQQVADKLRRKYCRQDDDTKQHQREAKSGETLKKSPKNPLVKARGRLARKCNTCTETLPMCKALHVSCQGIVPREQCDIVRDPLCLPLAAARTGASNFDWDCNASREKLGQISSGEATPLHASKEVAQTQGCRRRTKFSGDKGPVRLKSKYDKWKSQGLCSNWTIRTATDNGIQDEGIDCSDSGITVDCNRCADHMTADNGCTTRKDECIDKNTTMSDKTTTCTVTCDLMACTRDHQGDIHGNTADCHGDLNDLLSRQPEFILDIAQNGLLAQRERLKEKLVKGSKTSFPEMERESTRCRARSNNIKASAGDCNVRAPQERNAQTEVLEIRDTQEDGLCQSTSAPSLTSSTSDAILADQSSVTETSDSPAEGLAAYASISTRDIEELGVDVVSGPSQEQYGATAAMSGPPLGHDKICMCLRPKISKTKPGFPKHRCCHDWCTACCLPVAVCDHCNSTLEPGPSFLQRPVTQRRLARCGATAKHSSSDSEQAQEMCSASAGKSAQPPPPKLKRKRPSSSKDRGVSVPLMEEHVDHCLRTTEDRLDSLLTSLCNLPALSYDSDQDLFMDYLSLNIPAEYSWNSREDNSNQEQPENSLEDVDSQDLVSDSSTLHHDQHLSDTDVTDGEDVGVSSAFPVDNDEESGDADDEFECDCQHCVRFPIESADVNQHEDATEDSTFGFSLESLMSGLDDEGLEDTLNLERLTSLDITLLNTTTRLQVLEAIFETTLLRTVFRRHGFASPWEDEAPPPASDDLITSLPRLPVEQSHIDGELFCAICLSRCELGDQLNSLPCGHLFHPLCIGAWLAKSATCPVCRQAL